MSWQTSLLVAATVLGGALGLICCYDLVVYLVWGRQDTISHGVWLESQRHKWIPYALIAISAYVVGFFSCHFFGFG